VGEPVRDHVDLLPDDVGVDVVPLPPEDLHEQVGEGGVGVHQRLAGIEEDRGEPHGSR